jgi:hypothetical protein
VNNVFDSEKDVLSWYERQERTITKTFVSSIPWQEVKNYHLNSAFVPVLLYMRDIESVTDVYYRELLRTPTGRDPVIKRFMERWGVEETDHGELINRFLDEAGVETSTKWLAEARAKIPVRYKIDSYCASVITNCFGKHFSGTHMVWGAINEMTTLQGYRRLWQIAGHPVLEKVLRAIACEESAHANFYFNIARLKLQQSKLSRGLANFVISKFWTPVGQGIKPRTETDYVINTLFSGQQGLDFFDTAVSRRIQQLPGLSDLCAVTRRVAAVIS